MRLSASIPRNHPCRKFNFSDGRDPGISLTGTLASYVCEFLFLFLFFGGECIESSTVCKGKEDLLTFVLSLAEREFEEVAIFGQDSGVTILVRHG